MKIKNLRYRLIVYLIGMVTLACGLTLTAETDLGASALTAIPFVVSAYTGISFPNATLGMFVIFVALQIVIRRNKASILLFSLQIPLSILFTRIMGIAQSAIDIRHFSIWIRLAFLMLAIILTGTGAALGLRMRLIPNAGDGFVHTLAEHLGKPLGNVKNAVDFSCIAIAAIISYLLMGKITGVGIGSLLAMLGVGRVIALANKVCDSIGILKF